MEDKLSWQPTLAEHIVGEQLARLAQKKLSGGYEVPLLQFLPLGLWLFGKGAIFGRARRDKLDVVVKMFVEPEAVSTLFAPLGLPEQEAKSYQWDLVSLRKVASDGIRYYRDYHQKEPESLLDLLLTSFAPREVDFRDFDKARELAKETIRLGIALQQLDSWLFIGISLGAIFPELTERMWRQSYETTDHESWELAWKAGLNIPEEFTPLPLEEMEHEVLVEVASYASEYFPDLVDPLNLRLHKQE